MQTETSILPSQGVGPAAAGPAAPAGRDPELEKAAKAFEAIFLRQMLSAMREAKLAEGIFDSSESDQYRDLADAQLADSLAQTGKFGIADLLMQQFAPRQPVTPAPDMAALQGERK